MKHGCNCNCFDKNSLERRGGAARCGAEIQFDGQDTKIVILIENGGSAAGDVTFKAGSGIQGVADLVVNVANGKTKAVVLESGAFKKAGKVYVTGAATMKAAALLLP